MATVTSFEALQFPTRNELRQFAELFSPLFHASTEEARRQAVSALSQCPNVPSAVALFIASQPISIAAPFLVSSPCLSDDLLIMIARTQGTAHARAIVRREQLSPTVIDALVGLRHSEPPRDAARAGTSEAAADAGAATQSPARSAHAPAGPAPAKRSSARSAKGAEPPKAGAPASSSQPQAAPAARVGVDSTAAREEELRDQIRRLAAHVSRPASDRLGLRTITPMQSALLVRFARNREGGAFATTLADVLSSSRWLSERILLDISGRQLATTLLGVGMEAEEAVFVLEKLYPHLAKPATGTTRAEQLWNGLIAVECEERIETWRRADSYTFRPQEQEPAAAQPANATAPGANPTILPTGDTRSRPALRQRTR